MTELPDGPYSSDVLVEDGRSRPVVGGTRIRVTFDGGRLTAHAGCNTITGGCELVDGRLICGPLAMTMMAGSQDVMVQERWLAQLLEANPAVTVDPGRGAVILLADSRQVELLPETHAPAVPLAGTMWRLTEIRTSDGTVTVDRDTLAHIRADVLVADPGGVMSVQTGCNLGQAPVAVHADRMAIGPMRLTRRGCLPDAAPVERAMIAVLQGDVGYRLSGDELELSGGDLVLALHAEPAGTRLPPHTDAAGAAAPP